MTTTCLVWVFFPFWYKVVTFGPFSECKTVESLEVVPCQTCSQSPTVCVLYLSVRWNLVTTHFPGSSHRTDGHRKSRRPLLPPYLNAYQTRDDDKSKRKRSHGVGVGVQVWMDTFPYPTLHWCTLWIHLPSTEDGPVSPCSYYDRVSRKGRSLLENVLQRRVGGRRWEGS